MYNPLNSFFTEKEIASFKDFIHDVRKSGNKVYLRQAFLDKFHTFFGKVSPNRVGNRDSLFEFMYKIQEAVFIYSNVFLFYRPRIAVHQYLKFDMQKDLMEEITVSEYLESKERYILGNSDFTSPLKINFSPSHLYSPSSENSEDIGNGLKILLGQLAENFNRASGKWNSLLFDYLKTRKVDSRYIILNGNILDNYDLFSEKLDRLLGILQKMHPEIPFKNVRDCIMEYGFEVGLGNSMARIVQNLKLMKKIFSKPEISDLENLLTALPVISKIAITSPHGWFGQENVLGKPDTGGQVIYILDQVRGLEKVLKKQFAQSGLDIVPKIIVLTRLIPNAGNTTCNRRLEKIHKTENGWILRIPFRDRNGKIVQDWISRFHVWPYLDRFAAESEAGLLEEFSGKPDLIIGNYSDGNIVAALLSEALGATLCTIAHALEKTKYLLSDLLWKDLEDQYHFSLHFTSDLLAMNKSDFIVSSTCQEIAGTEESIGQYESYQSFCLPGYYRVISGSDIRDPKYNINPPGVDENYYFPYYENKKRDPSSTAYWEKRLFFHNDRDIFGLLNDPEKPSLFTMARLDKIKNLSGLIESFGKNSTLNEMANLIVAAGTIHFEESRDEEEKNEIKKIYGFVDNYKLNGKIRWLPSINKRETGEVYRIIADRRGIFVQPALFEGFGLTILEAMLSGLPAFGTMYGGPSEIIEDGVNGFLINPHDHESLAGVILKFLKKVKKEPSYWNKISEEGIRRVREHFTWYIYSERLINMAKLYGFWKHSSSPRDRLISERYWNVLYHFLMKQRAEKIS